MLLFKKANEMALKKTAGKYPAVPAIIGMAVQMETVSYRRRRSHFVGDHAGHLL